MKTVRTIGELRQVLEARRGNGPVGLVPTMGALHRGHLALVERCRKENATVVASIFVNPTQFNDKNDLVNYPRCEEKDCALLEQAGCDIAFVPSVGEIYPEPDTREFDFTPLDKVMEGANRPGHFNGVAQIVSKLFSYVEPDNAYFGEKDFQQLAIIRRMVEMLGLKLRINGVPIVREADGLAMSSRNMLLTPEQRAAAPEIYRTLRQFAGKRGFSVEETIRKVTEAIEANPLMKVEYFILADEKTLQPIADWKESDAPRGFVTVRLGSVRLIDNMAF